MSLPITAISHNTTELDTHHPPPPPPPDPEPTPLQQMDALASQGYSPQQIAMRLEVPLSQVETTLNIPASEAAQTTALHAAASKLSIHA